MRFHQLTDNKHCPLSATIFMAHKNKYKQPSPETQEDAMKIAKATQRPGQTREQTKLIAQGIQKGIDHYKKQQKSKSRELNRRLKQKPDIRSQEAVTKNQKKSPPVIYRQHWLPWTLLALTWIGAGFFILFFF